MKYITVKLTEDQARSVLGALWMSHSFSVYGEGRAEHQAFVQRIINKLAKLVKEEAKS